MQWLSEKLPQMSYNSDGGVIAVVKLKVYNIQAKNIDAKFGKMTPTTHFDL